MAGGRGEGHDHGGILDETQGLGAERVPQVVIRAAGREGGCVGFLGVGLDCGETFRAAFAWSPRWVGDGIVGGAEGCGAVGRVWSGTERGSVDEDEELGAAEVGVVEMGQDGLYMLGQVFGNVFLEHTAFSERYEPWSSWMSSKSDSADTTIATVFLLPPLEGPARTEAAKPLALVSTAVLLCSLCASTFRRSDASSDHLLWSG